MEKLWSDFIIIHRNYTRGSGQIYQVSNLSVLMLCLSKVGSGKAVFFYPILEEWKDIQHLGESEWMINYMFEQVAEREMLNHKGERKKMRKQGGSTIWSSFKVGADKHHWTVFMFDYVTGRPFSNRWYSWFSTNKGKIKRMHSLLSFSPFFPFLLFHCQAPLHQRNGPPLCLSS